MLFSDGEPSKMSEGWPLIHPELRSILVDLDHWSEGQRISRPVVTDLVRSQRKQVEIYVSLWAEAVAQLVAKGLIDGPDPERARTLRNEAVKLLARKRELPGVIPLILSGSEIEPPLRLAVAQVLAPSVLEDVARSRFTWHWCACAADLRTRHYSRPEKARVFDWLAKRCRSRDRYELLEHDTAGPHIHVAVRDEEWRTKWTKERNANV